jgi:AraC-like DNA-binding protein
MSVTGARVALAMDADERGAPMRAWRPLPTELADIVCIEETSVDVAPRIHGRLAVIVVRSAAVIRCESSRSLLAARSCVLVVPPGQLYALRAQGHPAGGTTTLLVGPVHLSGLEASDRAALVTDATLVDEVEALVAALSGPVPSIECATTIRALLERLTSPDASGPSPASQAAPLGRIRDYLRDNPTEPVTISDLARLAGLTESHLIRAFHREFGLPPHAYHLRRRLAAASELLAGGVSVSTVAYECGFADQSHLSRKFKEVYGLTPAAWAAAVGAGSRRKAPTNVVSIGVPRGLPRRDAQAARARNW